MDFSKIIAEQVSELKAELEKIAVHEPETDTWKAVPDENDLAVADPIDVADGVEEWGTRRALMAQLETRYMNLRRAEKKMVDGTYGTCEVCGGQIEPERLTANPAARTDIAHIEEEGNLPL